MDQAWKSINGFIVSFTSGFDQLKIQYSTRKPKKSSFRVPKGFSAPGLRGNPRIWSRAPGFAMLFCFNPKANPRIEKYRNFYFLNAVFISFFSTLLVFHSYLELFINHDQWMRLI